MFKGWARIYSGASGRRPWRILGASVFVLSGIAAFAAAPTALAASSAAWLTLALLHLVLVIVCTGAIYRWSGNAPWLALFFPVTGLFQLAFFAYALWWCLTNRMEWRGLAYSAAPSPALK